MKRTLQEQIAANRRNSVFYAFLIVFLLAGMGTAIYGAYYPNEWYIGTIGATALGGIMALVARYGGPKIVLTVAGAREATAAEYQMLNNVVEEMAIAAGVPVPKIYVIDDPSPNAFATGTSPENGIVAITTGLMHKLDRDELQGVMAHEIAHIRNYDVRFMTTIALVAGLIPLLADVFLRMQWYGGGRRRSNSNDNTGAILMVIGLVLAILAPIFAKLLEMAVSRQREYMADASAAEMTRYPEGLARALQKLQADPVELHTANRATSHMYIINPLRHSHQWMAAAFSTHPPIDERVKRLVGTMGVRQAPPMQSEMQTLTPPPRQQLPE
jgi:heat shock protein HtpX